MTAVKFVDAHMHLWDLSRIAYPWLTPPFSPDGPNGDVTPIGRDFGLEDYHAALARWNVVGMVHVEAGANADSAIAETTWLEKLRNGASQPNGLVAFAALHEPDAAAKLAAQAAHPGVRGIRQILNWHRDPRRTYTTRDFLQDERWADGYALLERHGLAFDLQCYPGQMRAMAAIAERHPGTPVIVNHMGMPVLEDADGVEDWRGGMRSLARLPHVAVKISGMGFAIRQWSSDQVRPFILETIEMFGAHRCMFASDLPTDTLFGSIDRHMETYHQAVEDFSAEQRAALFGANANRIYRLGLTL